MPSTIITFKNSLKVKAFTLLETLTSIAILALIIVGPLAVIMASSSYARQTKNVMTSSYLAEEAIELLQNRYDSLYLFCKNQPSDPFCVTTTDETSGQIAWRLFKHQFTAVDGYPSCYIDDNPSGCRFDFLNMMTSSTTTPPRYTHLDTECPFLVGVETPIPGEEGQTLHTFACQGIPSHITGEVDDARFSRSLTIEQIPTFELSVPIEEQYNDDLRVTAQVQFRGVNGVSQTQSITRFFHARP